MHTYLNNFQVKSDEWIQLINFLKYNLNISFKKETDFQKAPQKNFS